MSQAESGRRQLGVAARPDRIGDTRNRGRGKQFGGSSRNPAKRHRDFRAGRVRDRFQFEDDVKLSGQGRQRGPGPGHVENAFLLFEKGIHRRDAADSRHQDSVQVDHVPTSANSRRRGNQTRKGAPATTFRGADRADRIENVDHSHRIARFDEGHTTVSNMLSGLGQIFDFL